MIAHNLSTLAELRISQTARIAALSGSPATRQRLAEMGFTPGCAVRLVRSAPLGDPIQVAVRGYQLSLRRSEMRCVLVEPDMPAAPADKAEIVNAA